MELKLLREEDLVNAAIELCSLRVSKEVSKRQMDKKHNINAHTLNNIEKGKSVPLLLYMTYIRSLGGELVVKIPEKKKK